jgi:preprotein translocase subunit SecF
MEEQPAKTSLKEKIKHFYFKEYKKLMIIPFALLLAAIAVLGYQFATTGEFVEKGISLKGGTSIAISTETLNPSDITLLYTGEINIRTLSGAGKQIGLVIEVDTTDPETVQQIQDKLMETYGLEPEEITAETIGSAFGESFYRQTVKALIIAFIFMGILVFFTFRTFVPSTAVILAAASDIIVTLAITDIMGMKLSTAGIAAYLMLIGYSVDTDILLSTKALKQKEGTVNERILAALKTGVLMTLTAITAIIVALVFSQNPVIDQIMTIILIGLAVDLINTWIQNVGILKWYMERKA